MVLTLAGLSSTWRVTLDVACNWKLILENAVETYHTGIVHRDIKPENLLLANGGSHLAKLAVAACSNGQTGAFNRRFNEFAYPLAHQKP